jgi:hypothetical protein
MKLMNIPCYLKLFFSLMIVVTHQVYASSQLVAIPDQVYVNNGTEPTIGSFQLDLSPEAKAALRGSGSIDVQITPNTWEVELLSPARAKIAYVNGVTVPVNVRFRKGAWMPNPSNEITGRKSTGLFFSAAIIGNPSPTLYVSIVSRGSYYSTVKDYAIRNQALNPWIGLNLDYLDHPVSYQVPESAFKLWAPMVQGEQHMAAGWKLGYNLADLTALGTDQVVGPYGLYELKAFGWSSYAEMQNLESQYISQVRPVNDNFSFSLRNRVPVAYFLAKLPTLPPNLSTGDKDNAIAAAYHYEQGLAKVGSMGLPNILQNFAADYNLTNYSPVPPHAVEAMARTSTNPAWRAGEPLALVVYSRAASEEGTFSEAAIIGTLARTHRLIVAQAGTTSEFLAVAQRAYQRHGAFGIVVLAGHGNMTSAVMLGIQDSDAFIALRAWMTTGGTVLLAACSTAEYMPDTITNHPHFSSHNHFAAAMQASMPDARIVGAEDLISQAMVTFHASSTSPEQRYRVFFHGSGAWGDVPGLAPRGTPKDWLRREFGTGLDWAALENADSDGDGQPNWLEYRAGTNPRSATDVLKLSVQPGNPCTGCASLSWPGTRRNGYTESFSIIFTPTGGRPQYVATRLQRPATGINRWTDTVRRNSGTYSIEGFPGSSVVWTPRMSVSNDGRADLANGIVLIAKKNTSLVEVWDANVGRLLGNITGGVNKPWFMTALLRDNTKITVSFELPAGSNQFVPSVILVTRGNEFVRMDNLNRFIRQPLLTAYSASGGQSQDAGFPDGTTVPSLW